MICITGTINYLEHFPRGGGGAQVIYQNLFFIIISNVYIHVDLYTCSCITVGWIIIAV
jgi:hypothetical protein